MTTIVLRGGAFDGKQMAVDGDPLGVSKHVRVGHTTARLPYARTDEFENGLRVYRFVPVQPSWEKKVLDT